MHNGGTSRQTVQTLKKFLFTTKSVELEGPANDAHRYRVEGVTINGSRFLVDCSDFPSPAVLKGVSSEEWVRRVNETKDVEAFRKTALESVGLASLDSRWNRLTLYRNVISTDVVGKVQTAEGSTARHEPLDEPFADCPIVSRIENAAVMLSLDVLSSEFRNGMHSVGYELQGATADEALTLGCTENRRTVCMSLPPGTYRATRSGSEVRLYNLYLKLVGVYRILSEQPYH